MRALVGPGDALTLHAMVAAVGGAKRPDLRRLLKLKADVGELTEGDEKKLRALVRTSEKEILASAEVICVTCAGAGDKRLEGMRFAQVVLDEATQACEPEALIPIVSGAQQLLLVGDHCQVRARGAWFCAVAV